MIAQLLFLGHFLLISLSFSSFSLSLSLFFSSSFSQDIPTHLATPMKSHSNTLTPFKPLSTSDPSCYGTEATPSGHPTAPPTAPLGLMATPAEMIMGSCCKIGKPGSNILRQPKGFMSGMRIASDIKAYRSPFIGRLRTPNADSAKCFKVSFVISSV